MTHDEMIAVIQAHKDGKQIEYLLKPVDRWVEIHDPQWDFLHYDYRIKPEPREWYLAIQHGTNSASHTFYNTERLERWKHEHPKHTIIKVREVLE